MGHKTLGRARHGEESGPQRRCPDLVQEVLVSCAVPSRTEIDEPLQAKKDGHERVWEDVEKNPTPRRRKGARQKMERWNLQEKKEESPECPKLREEFETGSSMAQKELRDIENPRSKKAM